MFPIGGRAFMFHLIAQASGGPFDQLVVYGPLGILGLAALRFFWSAYKGLADDRDAWVKAYQEVVREARMETAQMMFKSAAAIEKSGEANAAALTVLAEFRGWLDAREHR